jgi:hypothetical protein
MTFSETVSNSRHRFSLVKLSKIKTTISLFIKKLYKVFENYKYNIDFYHYFCYILLKISVNLTKNLCVVVQ